MYAWEAVRSYRGRMMKTLKILAMVGGVLLVVGFLFVGFGWVGVLGVACALLGAFSTAGDDGS